MQRAVRTAHLAGFDHPQITPLLKEVDYGRYEGLTSNQIHASNPDWEIFRDGSPGGESPDQIYARAGKFIDLTTQQAGASVLAFGHGHILRAVAVAWIQAGIRVASGLQLDVATLSILSDSGRGPVIALWNAP